MRNTVCGITSLTLFLPFHPGMPGDTGWDINSASHGDTPSSHFGLYEGTENGLIYSSPIIAAISCRYSVNPLHSQKLNIGSALHTTIQYIKEF